MKKLLLFLKNNPALMAALTVALCFASVKLLDGATEDETGSVLLRILLSIVCGAVLYAVSGPTSFEISVTFSGSTCRISSPPSE